MGLGSAVLHTGGDEVVMGLGLGLGSAVLHTGGDEVVNHAVPRHDVDVKAVLLVDGHCRAGLLAHVPDAHLARVRVRDGVRDGVRVSLPWWRTASTRTRACCTATPTASAKPARS